MREAPYAPGLPLIGNLHQMAGDIPQFMVAQYGQLGPVFRVRMLGREFTVLAGLEANRFFLTHGRELTCQGDLWDNFNDVQEVSRTLVSLDGNDHRALRRAMAPSLSAAHIRRQSQTAWRIAAEEIDAWPSDQPVEVQSALRRIVMGQLGDLCAHHDGRAYRDDLTNLLGSSVMATQVGGAYWTWMPWHRQMMRRLATMKAEILELHASGSTEGSDKDLVDNLMALSAEQPEVLPPSDLGGLALSPYLAGLDTAASIASYLLYELLSHPELLGECVEEVDAWVDAREQGDPVRLTDLDKVNRATRETLRLHALAPILIRKARRDFEFDGVRMAEGEILMVAQTVVHQLAEHYPDPEAFDIDRYLPERAEHRPRGVFAPFGLGAHVCLGQGFAMGQVVATIAALVHRCQVTLDPPDYRLREARFPIPSPNKGFRVRVQPRLR